LGQPYQSPGFRIGNRFCILPMEGWDGTERDCRTCWLTGWLWGAEYPLPLLSTIPPPRISGTYTLSRALPPANVPAPRGKY
jgi:hypothetical protein